MNNVDKLTFNSAVTYTIDVGNAIISPNSTVYKGVDEFGRNVCIKRVLLQGNRRQIDNQYRAARAECITLAKIAEYTHHVPVVYADYVLEYDLDKRYYYIVMQWIDGTSLREKISTSEPEEFLFWMSELCSILESMSGNDRGMAVYHKDIKPENIIIGNDRKLYLIDFNISTHFTNVYEGTEGYKAPEMGQRSVSTSRDKVDIFAIGVMMYEFFSGERPAYGKHYMGEMRNQQGHYEWGAFTTPKEKEHTLANGINQIITDCMKLDPRDRPMYRDLERRIRDQRKQVVNRSRGK